MAILDNLYANTLGQHFDNTGNLRAATRQGLISEPQYKTMSGYDASQTIPGITDNPLVTGAASGAYNLAKSILSPEDYFNPNTYQPQIGPIDSTLLNIQGSIGLSPQDKEKYEGIVSLDPKSLGMGQWSEEDLTDFSGVYDDDEKGTIPFDPNNPQFKQAGFTIPSMLMKWAKARAQSEGIGRIREQIQAQNLAKKKAAMRQQVVDAERQRLQAKVTAQANRGAAERVSRGEARDYGHTQTRSSSGWRSDPMAQGGLAYLWPR